MCYKGRFMLIKAFEDYTLHKIRDDRGRITTTNT